VLKKQVLDAVQLRGQEKVALERAIKRMAAQKTSIGIGIAPGMRILGTDTRLAEQGCGVTHV